MKVETNLEINETWIVTKSVHYWKEIKKKEKCDQNVLRRKMSIILMGIYKIFIGKVIKRCFRLKAEPVSLRRLSSHHASSSNSADARGLILL